MFELCRLGDTRLLKELLESDPSLLETFDRAADSDGRSAFYVACMEGREGVIEFLLESGLAAQHLTAANRNGCTPCYVAARRGHAKIVEILAKRAVSLSTPTNDGDTPVWIAAYQGHCDVIKLLKKHGCSLEYYNRNGATPLYAAAQQNQVDVVKFLLESGVDVDRAMRATRARRSTDDDRASFLPFVRSFGPFGPFVRSTLSAALGPTAGAPATSPR